MPSKAILRLATQAIVGVLITLPGVVNAAMVYNSAGSFTSALQPGYYSTTFDSFASTSYSSISQNTGTYKWTATASSGALYISPSTSGRALSTFNSDRDIVINFTSGNVTAVGANLYLGDINGSQINFGTVRATLSDGTFVDLTSGGSPFAGFSTSGGTVITKLTIHPNLGGTYAYMDNFYVGEVAPVPEASTTISVALLCCAVAGSAVRNRLRNRKR